MAMLVRISGVVQVFGLAENDDVLLDRKLSEFVELGKSANMTLREFAELMRRATDQNDVCIVLDAVNRRILQNYPAV